ncbi:MAG: nucleotide sugar dehydrogenase [Geminicoccaceae bacterium]
MSSERIGVLGLGYVGLPVAVALADVFADVRGFDIQQRRIAALRAGVDATGEVDGDRLRRSGLQLCADIDDLRGCTFFVVAVPTPIDQRKQPDLSALVHACQSVGAVLERGALVAFESTVYPGVTEEICAAILAETSKLQPGSDFALGYSPERINPGDAAHGLSAIIKVIAAQDDAGLERMRTVYGAVVSAGLHEAPDIRTAEAAKVIENTQRDLNIALMNELALIFERLDLRTADVLAAASTKWNFLPFTPGLVGGHCIGVDPYYLTAKAEAVGYHPQVILAGRRINDAIGPFVAQKTLKLLAAQGRSAMGAKIAVLGLAFKPDVPDARNSKVPDIVAELRAFGADVRVHDPLVSAEAAAHEYGLALCALDDVQAQDALILAVPHRTYLALGTHDLAGRVQPGGVIIDVKSVLQRAELPGGLVYWSL